MLVLAILRLAATAPVRCTITEELGCFEDAGAAAPASERVLPNVASATGGKGPMSREVCAATVAAILGLGEMSSTLIGVEYGSECYYGAKQQKFQKSASCNMACTSNSSEVCGGYYAINVLNATCHALPPPGPPPAGPGPCDILDAAGNPCVAAHSTVRALYGEYNGPLYTVTRTTSQGSERLSIGVLTPGGFANASAQDQFCAGKVSCVISNVIDQSPNGNHLGQRHGLVDPRTHMIIVGNGYPVYGMWFDPGFGYHVDKTRGIATGTVDPECIPPLDSPRRISLIQVMTPNPSTRS